MADGQRRGWKSRGGRRHRQGDTGGRKTGGRRRDRTFDRAWAFVDLGSGAGDPLGLVELAEAIPDDWLWHDARGGHGRREADHIHSSFALKLSRGSRGLDGNVDILREVAAAAAPFEMSIAEVYCSRVGRISYDTVFAVSGSGRKVSLSKIGCSAVFAPIFQYLI